MVLSGRTDAPPAVSAGLPPSGGRARPGPQGPPRPLLRRLRSQCSKAVGSSLSHSDLRVLGLDEGLLSRWRLLFGTRVSHAPPSSGVRRRIRRPRGRRDQTGSSTKRLVTGLSRAPLPYGDQVLVGGIRGKILGGGWVDRVVQKQHPSGRVTVRIHGRNHVVSGKEVLPKRLSFTVRIPAELARPERR
jgi:hypothetical protein